MLIAVCDSSQTCLFPRDMDIRFWEKVQVLAPLPKDTDIYGRLSISVLGYDVFLWIS